MKKLSLMFLLLPFVLLGAYGCDEEMPSQPEHAVKMDGADTPNYKPNEPSTPRSVAFLARLETTLSGQSEVWVIFDDVRFNHGEGYDAVSGRFSAPVRGVYAFSVSVTQQALTSSTASALVTVQFDVNGTGYSTPQPNGHLLRSATPSIVVALEQGDEVRVRSLNNVSATQQVTDGHFGGHLVYSY